MNFPAFYDPANAAKWSYDPNLRTLNEQAASFRAANKVKAAGQDAKRVAFLLIDVQRDFCFPEGTLYVGGRSGTGAIDDSRRIAEFVYREMGSITSVIPTMDTHFAFQIFTPSFWMDENGQPLLPHDMIDGNLEILRGGNATGLKARPNPAMAPWLTGGDYGWLAKQVAHYVRELAKGGKYLLYVWPEHCVLGSVGHSLAGVVQEARMFHAYVRGSQNEVEVKGGNPLTENYSVLGPEVVTRWDGRGAIGQKNARFVKTLLDYDAVVIAGQASSHCVKSTIDDLLGEINAKDPELAKKVYVLRDCTSAVVVPGVVDFTPQAEEALDRYAAAGMNIVESTRPMASWLK